MEDEPTAVIFYFFLFLLFFDSISFHLFPFLFLAVGNIRKPFPLWVSQRRRERVYLLIIIEISSVIKKYPSFITIYFIFPCYFVIFFFYYPSIFLLFYCYLLFFLLISCLSACLSCINPHSMFGGQCIKERGINSITILVSHILSPLNRITEDRLVKRRSRNKREE
jgi:hypothetical protein